MERILRASPPQEMAGRMLLGKEPHPQLWDCPGSSIPVAQGVIRIKFVVPRKFRLQVII